MVTLTKILLLTALDLTVAREASITTKWEIYFASDASSSDDRIFAESFLQFADHYYRLQKEKELNNINKEAKINPELTSITSNSPDINIDNSDKNTKKTSRRKRGYEIRQAEISALENNDESTEVKKIKSDKAEDSNLSI